MIPIRFSFFRELIGILFKEEERNRQNFMHLNNITELAQGISKCPTNTVLVGECRAMKKIRNDKIRKYEIITHVITTVLVGLPFEAPTTFIRGVIGKPKSLPITSIFIAFPSSRTLL
jgi:hypothetical protein